MGFNSAFKGLNMTHASALDCNGILHMVIVICLTETSVICHLDLVYFFQHIIWNSIKFAAAY